MICMIMTEHNLYYITYKTLAIVDKIDKKLDFISITQALCHSGHVPYENVFTSSRYLEGAILVYLRKLEIVARQKA